MGIDFNEMFAEGLAGLVLSLLGFTWLVWRAWKDRFGPVKVVTVLNGWVPFELATVYVGAILIMAFSQTLRGGLIIGALGVIVPCLVLGSQISRLSIGGPSK